MNYSKNRICFLKENYLRQVTLAPFREFFKFIAPMNPTLNTKIAHPTTKSESERKWVCKYSGLKRSLACISSMTFMNIGMSSTNPRSVFFSCFYFTWLYKGMKWNNMIRVCCTLFTCLPHYVVEPVFFLKRLFSCFWIASFQGSLGWQWNVLSATSCLFAPLISPKNCKQLPRTSA